MKYRRQVSTCLFATLLALLVAVDPIQAAPPEPEKLTLADSIKLALANNPAIKIAQADSEKARWKLNEARAYNGFKLDYSYTWGRTNQPPSWYNNTTGNYPVSYNPLTKSFISYPAWSETSEGTYNFYDQGFQLQLPIYTGGKIESSISLAKHGKAAVDLGAIATRQQLTVEVTTAYFNVLQTRNLADVANRAVQDLSIHLKNVQTYYDVGTVALPDVLQTEVRLANARNNLSKAQNAYQLTRYKLNKITGLSLHNDATLVDDFSFRPSEPVVDDSVAMALRIRPEMAQAKLKIDMAKDRLHIAQSGHLPTAALIASEKWKDTTPSTSKDANSWMIGANVQFNVFDNGITRAEIKQAEQEITAAQEQLRQAEDNITLEVCQAYLNVQEAIERIANNKVAVNQSETDYKMTQERYENGVAINLDVMDAELAMTQARTNYIQALYDYNISRSKLDKAMGIIN